MAVLGSGDRAGGFLLALLLFTALPVSANTLQGRVIRIADGDSLTVVVDGRRQARACLAHVDALEWSQPFRGAVEGESGLPCLQGAPYRSRN